MIRIEIKSHVFGNEFVVFLDSSFFNELCRDSIYRVLEEVVKRMCAAGRRSVVVVRPVLSGLRVFHDSLICEYRAPVYEIVFDTISVTGDRLDSRTYRTLIVIGIVCNE